MTEEAGDVCFYLDPDQLEEILQTFAMGMATLCSSMAALSQGKKGPLDGLAQIDMFTDAIRPNRLRVTSDGKCSFKTPDPKLITKKP